MSIKVEGFWKLLCEFAPGKVHWTAEDMPDMTGKVVIVTGGNSGIGYETIKALLLKNATVYMGARSVTKAESAINSLIELTGNPKVFLLQMDLADLLSVKKAAEEFQKKEKKLHVLINNAGVMNPPVELLTAQNYDLQFGTNVLGHYLLSKLLIPIMETTAATLPATEPVRLIEVTSSGHLVNSFTGKGLIRYDTLRPGKARDANRTNQLYFQSKSGNILVARVRARILAGKNIVTIAVHPGHIHSELTRYSNKVEAIMLNFILYPTPMGAITQLYAATAPEAAKLNGEYMAPWARVKPPRSDHNDPEIEDKLIVWLEEQLRINQMDTITPLYAATAPETAQLNGKYLGPRARVREPRSDHVNNVESEDKLIA